MLLLEHEVYPIGSCVGQAGAADWFGRPWPLQEMKSAEEVKQRARSGGFYSLALLLNPGFSVTSSGPRWAASC